jgi:hypothetical protein
VAKWPLASYADVLSFAAVLGLYLQHRPTFIILDDAQWYVSHSLVSLELIQSAYATIQTLLHWLLMCGFASARFDSLSWAVTQQICCNFPNVVVMICSRPVCML